MREHCHEYGFILRYPKKQSLIFGFAYEPWHLRYVGKEVEVKLYKAIDGVKNLQGVLESFDAESGAVVVTVDGKTYELTLADIAKANLAVVF